MRATLLLGSSASSILTVVPPGAHASYSASTAAGVTRMLTGSSLAKRCGASAGLRRRGHFVAPLGRKYAAYEAGAHPSV